LDSLAVFFKSVRGRSAAAVALRDPRDVAEPSFDPAAQVGAMAPLGFFDPLGLTRAGDEAGFRSLREVVRQVQLESRIIRRWKSQQGMEFRHTPSACDMLKVQIEEWDKVDILQIETDTQKPLVHIFMNIWNSRSLASLCKAPSDQVLQFIQAVEAAYHPNLYHNRAHAAEVTYTAYYLWAQLDAQDHMRGYFSSADLLALIFASADHDMAHPGTANDFLVKTQHALALRYSDRSVLEHYHIASAFALMKEMDIPLLEHGLPSPPPETLKNRVVDMVLATDMAQHRRVIDGINAEVAIHQAQDIDKLALEPHLLHLADIGHPLRLRSVHKEWSSLIREEFFQQGDQEKTLGLHPTPLCDREKAPTLAKSQQGFLSFVMMPSWRPMGQLLGQAAKQLEVYLVDNQVMWEELAEEERFERSSERKLRKSPCTQEASPPKTGCYLRRAVHRRGARQSSDGLFDSERYSSRLQSGTCVRDALLRLPRSPSPARRASAVGSQVVAQGDGIRGGGVDSLPLMGVLAVLACVNILLQQTSLRARRCHVLKIRMHPFA